MVQRDGSAGYVQQVSLEHAPRHPLGLRAKDLIAGIAGDDGQPEVLTRQEVGQYGWRSASPG